MNRLKINHLAVWIIVVLGQIIPAVWYGIFADSWMAYNNLKMEDIDPNNFKPYVVSIITSVAFSYMLAWVFVRMNVTTWLDGLKTGIIMGFPIAILGTMTTNMFSLRPYGLAWIDGGANLIIWVIAGMLLGAWTKEK